MPMPESSEQLLGGIATALSQDVVPHVEDPFALMQLKAAIELLENLTRELDWSAPFLERRGAELKALRAALRAAGYAGPCEVLADEVGAGLRWLAGQPAAARAPVDALLRAAVDREVAELRRGMFR
jgi:hypothetical protein